MGRKAIAAEEKLARGNAGRRPVRVTPEDQAPVLGIEPPDWLQGDAREIFLAELPWLNALRFVRRSDREAFAHLCAHAAMFRDAVRDLAENGKTYWTESNHGKMLRLNPAYQIMVRSGREFASLADAFGMRPDARQRMLQQMASAVPPDNDLLKRRAEHRQPEEDPAEPDLPRPTHDGPLGFLN